MLTRPSPLDLRIDYSIVGHAPDESSARLINERLDAMADWMTGPDETRQSLAWRDWLKIARPDQLPPQFDPNWREWKIGGDRGSGKTTAAAQFIASQTANDNLRVYCIAPNNHKSNHALGILMALQSIGKIKNVTSGGIVFEDGCTVSGHSAGSDLHSLIRQDDRKKIVWLDELLFLPREINVGSFHSFTHALLRSNCRVIWSG